MGRCRRGEVEIVGEVMCERVGKMMFCQCFLRSRSLNEYWYLIVERTLYQHVRMDQERRKLNKTNEQVDHEHDAETIHYTHD